MQKTWTRIAAAPGDHRLFEDENGRVAVADRSGPTPDRTDDGILWLKRHGDAYIYVSQYTGALRVSYEVVDDVVGPERTDGGVFRVSSGLHVLPVLKDWRYKISILDDLADAIRTLKEYDLLNLD